MAERPPVSGSIVHFLAIKLEKAPARGAFSWVRSVSPWGRARTQDAAGVDVALLDSVSPWGRARTQDFPAALICSNESVSPWGRARTQDLHRRNEVAARSVSPWGRARTQDLDRAIEQARASVSPWGRARTQDNIQFLSFLYPSVSEKAHKSNPPLGRDAELYSHAGSPGELPESVLQVKALSPFVDGVDFVRILCFPL